MPIYVREWLANDADELLKKIRKRRWEVLEEDKQFLERVSQFDFEIKSSAEKLISSPLPDTREELFTYLNKLKMIISLGKEEERVFPFR